LVEGHFRAFNVRTLFQTFFNAFDAVAAGEAVQRQVDSVRHNKLLNFGQRLTSNAFSLTVMKVKPSSKGKVKGNVNISDVAKNRLNQQSDSFL
jgi:hypothetical protein